MRLGVNVIRCVALVAIAAAATPAWAQAQTSGAKAASGELEGLREEVVALEREIAAMRSELAGARTRVENEAAMARAANEELEKNRKLITRARALLADLVDGKDRAGKA